MAPDSGREHGRRRMPTTALANRSADLTRVRRAPARPLRAARTDRATGRDARGIRREAATHVTAGRALGTSASATDHLRHALRVQVLQRLALQRELLSFPTHTRSFRRLAHEHGARGRPEVLRFDQRKRSQNTRASHGRSAVHPRSSATRMRLRPHRPRSIRVVDDRCSVAQRCRAPSSSSHTRPRAARGSIAGFELYAAEWIVANDTIIDPRRARSLVRSPCARRELGLIAPSGAQRAGCGRGSVVAAVSSSSSTISISGITRPRRSTLMRKRAL